MAESVRVEEKSLEELESEITCPICQEHYTEPKVLPCLHYYCKKCILKLALRTHSGKSFHCPECRCETTLPEGGVDHFKAAFFANRLKSKVITLQRAYGKVEVKCEFCTASSNAEAFCRQCSCFICSECVQSHSKVRSFSAHEIATLEDLKHGRTKPIAVKKSPIQMCRTHKQPFIIFCSDCEKLICQHCTLKDHLGHNYEFTNVAVTGVKTKLLNYIQPIKDLDTELSYAVEMIRATTLEVETQKESAVNNLHTSFKELHSILERREQELVEDATTIAQQKLQKLSQQEKTLSLASANLQSIVDYTERCVSLSTDNELVSMETEMQKMITQKVQEHRKSEKSLEPVEEADVAVEVTCAEALQQLCLMQANITTAAVRATAKEPPNVKCEVHKKPLIIYCYDCSSLICQHCTMKGHLGHNYEFTKKTTLEDKTKLLEEIYTLTLQEELAKGREKFCATSIDMETEKQSTSNLRQCEEDAVEVTIYEILQEAKAMLPSSAEIHSVVDYILQHLGLSTGSELVSINTKKLEELEKKITCPICLDHYTDPKILPCFHYYCKMCIFKLALSTESGKPFRCPLCRHEAPLPEGGVDNLKTGFFADRLKSTVIALLRAHSKAKLKRDDGEKSRIQPLSLKGADTDKAKSIQSEDYPLLPASLKEVADLVDVPSGFPVKKAISISYKGEKGSVTWKEGGLHTCFEESKECKSEEAPEILICVSDVVEENSTFPVETEELVSQVYFISSSQKLNTSVTLKILHHAEDKDVDKLSFLTCTSHQPPYTYEFLPGGHFMSNYGEITVQRFSFITIGRLILQHGFRRGILYYWEKNYEAALYCSVQPKQIGSELKWALYLCVTKNCEVFRSSLKKYIKEQRRDDIQLLSANIARFSDTEDFITASVNCRALDQDVQVCEPDTVIMQKTDIKHYADGCPPFMVYQLLAKRNSKFKVVYTVNGFESNMKFTLHQHDLPQLCPAPPSRTTSQKSTASETSESESLPISCATPCSSQETASLFIQDDTICCSTIKKELSKIFPASKAEDLGLQLGLPHASLKEFSHDSQGDSKKMMQDILQYWLENDKDKSWLKLAEAIKECGYGVLADNIRSKYCISPPTHSTSL